MIATSQEYKEYFEENHILGELEMIASLSIEDVAFKNNADMNVNDEIYFSNFEYLMTEQRDNFNYATLEKNFWVLDDHQYLPHENSTRKCWTSNYMSNANKEFEEDEIPCLYMIARDTGYIYNSIGMTFTFDDIDKNYPTKIKIETYNGNTKVQDFIVENEDGINFVMDTSLNDYNKVYIYFLKTKNPYRRISVNNIVWGIVKSFTPKNIIEAKGIDISDPLSREIPNKSISITVDNMDLSYNQDNPLGINKYLQEQQNLSVKFIDHMIDGTQEEIDYGYYLLDGKPEVDGREATFNANGYLFYADKNFYKQTYTNEPVSFKTLAEMVLEDMELPLDGDGEKRYYVDDSLDDMYCNVPLPLDSHRELLKLIAQATFCTLRETKDGYIRIEPNYNLLQDVNIDFSEQSDEPKGETSDLIRQIDVKQYSVSVDTGNNSELYSNEHTINGTNVLVHIEYSNPSYTASATMPTGMTLSSANYYVNGCDLYITTSGEVTGEIKVTGKKLNKASTTVSSQLSILNGTTGEIDNELVSNETIAKMLADEWLAYAQYRNKYTLKLDNKYDLRLESLDIVKFETQFTQVLKGKIQSLEWTYTGGLGGEVQIKSFGEYEEE